MAGLTLASCACLVVWLVCSYEFSFDTFHPNHDRIYRLTSRTDHGGNVLRWPRVLAPVPAALRKNLTTERLLSRTLNILPFSNMTGLPVTRRPR